MYVHSAIVKKQHYGSLTALYVHIQKTIRRTLTINLFSNSYQDNETITLYVVIPTSQRLQRSSQKPNHRPMGFSPQQVFLCGLLIYQLTCPPRPLSMVNPISQKLAQKIINQLYFADFSTSPFFYLNSRDWLSDNCSLFTIFC